MRSLLAIFLILFFSASAIAQLAFPIPRAVDVTGYFGEFRGTSRELSYSGHFHTGIDVSTGGRIGVELIAPEQGYISSIIINHPLYGVALVLALPDIENIITNEKGVKLLFAHLDSVGDFSTQTGRRVGDIYRSLLQAFPQEYVEAEFDPREFPVSRGDIIGRTGDTGDVPPHLHMEVRDMGSELYINPGYYFDLGNPESEVQILEIRAGGRAYRLDAGANPLIEVTEGTSLSVRTHVRLRHNVSPRRIDLFIGDLLVYQIDFSHFTEDERYMVDNVYVNSTETIYWFLLKTQNEDNIITVNRWDSVDLSEVQQARIVVRDHWGNSTERTFRILLQR
ncbi:MAG TPA: hypothetical protein DCE14_01685 [Kosmotogaceae bacterium]|nr:hypothetical protein [Kosmotogaceae bacterium]